MFVFTQASLTYAEAQMRIDDAHMNDDITKSLRGLNRLAKILKRQRIEKGLVPLFCVWRICIKTTAMLKNLYTHDPVQHRVCCLL